MVYRNKNRPLSTANTATLKCNQLNEEMCKFLMQLASPHELSSASQESSMVYNRMLNTSYIISASQTPTSMSFVSQISPVSNMHANNGNIFFNSEKLSSSDLPMSSALSFLSSTLYSSSKTFNDEQISLKKPPGILYHPLQII